MATAQVRSFSQLETRKVEEQVIDVDERNRRLGVDMQFNEQKHAYVLTFPWNFQEIIREYETGFRALPESNYWHKFVKANGFNEFNTLFREFHQFCALPDYLNFDKICEPKLAQYMRESVRRIQFHGLDLELANLRVEQPRIKVLKVEVHHGLQVDRSRNLSKNEYTVSKSSLFGAPQSVYVPKNDTRSFLDHLDSNHKPYLISATCLIESPMKLYVQNQNYSAVLFGSTDEEIVKNVVRFETNVRWLDVFKVLNVENKKELGWKITDFNNILNENPYFTQY